jgi:Zn finger protein HypA/HybF involved in hydrogenase expression
MPEQTRLERAMEIVAADEHVGICIQCGHEQSAEPDLRDGWCQNCHNPTVKGAEEFLLECL